MPPLSIAVFILMILGLVLLGLHALWNPAPPSPPRLNLMSAGLACWLLAEIIIRASSH